jgi:hypothetical protein
MTGEDYSSVSSRDESSSSDKLVASSVSLESADVSATVLSTFEA